MTAWAFDLWGLWVRYPDQGDQHVGVTTVSVRARVEASHAMQRLMAALARAADDVEANVEGAIDALALAFPFPPKEGGTR